MARYPQLSNSENREPHWTTSKRPTKPAHGTIGYNDTTQQIECYDAIHGYWMTTVSLSEVYP